MWDTIQEKCQDISDYIDTHVGEFKFDSQQECVDFIKTLTICLFLSWGLIVIPFNIVIVRILFWGWKQQEYIAIGDAAQRNFLQHVSNVSREGYGYSQVNND